jgi:Ala-tRNA(Pro) deacylase
MKNTGNKIRDYLFENNIVFEVLHHEKVGDPVEYSKKIGTRLDQQAKALLLRCKLKNGDKRFVVVSVPAHKKADFEKIISFLPGIKSIRIAEKEQLFELTNCQPGELPPLGKLWGLKLFIDRDLLIEPKVYFNAGSLNYSIIANPMDIVALEEAIIF